MKWGWVFVGAFLVLGLLVACAEGEEVVVNTAVPTPPPTIEPTATETAVPVNVVEETVVPTNTVTQTPTLEPTITTTPERFVRFETGPDGQPYPAVSITDVDVANYQLTKPDAAILFQVLLLTMQETCNYDRDHQFLIDYAGQDLFRMLAYEAGKFTDEEWENAIWLIQDTENCLGEGYSFFVPEIVPQALQIGMVNFLNQNKIEFDPIVQIWSEVNFRAISIDYDPEFSEWLVEAIFIRYDLRVFVPIYEDDFGTYHLIPNDFSPQLIRSLFGRELKTSIDLTGDGANEIIVVTRIDGSTAVGHPGFIEIFSWNEGVINKLGTLWIGDERSFSAAFDTEYTIADFNNDSVPDIEVVKPHYNFDFPDCNWLERHLYSWQGAEVNSTIEFLEEPNRSECSSSDIDYAGSSLLIDSTFLVDTYDYDVSSDYVDYVLDESDEELNTLVYYQAPIVQRQILTERDLGFLQGVLERTLDRMDAEESYYQPSHLLYLLGLNYELSGDEENAVSIYLELIQQYPTSPWSWLAWARLEPVAG